MVMEQIVVKTEVQNNGEILLYYVDENGESQQGIVTTIENVENSGLQLQDNYILSNLEDYIDDPSMQQVEMEQEDFQNNWSDDDTRRLLIFYNDNKQVFTMSGPSQRQHLWSVACKTMLIGKDYVTCEVKLNELKSKYAEVHSYTEKGLYVKWPFLELCQQAFHEVTKTVEIEDKKPTIAVLKQETLETNNKVVKQITTKIDGKVEQMLNIYLKYKQKFQQEHWRKDLWDTIALELGEEENGEYWHKRFLNYKQHYINLLMKQQENGSSVVSWPYLELFNKIFADDAAFHKKIFNTAPRVVSEQEPETPADTEHDWNTTHMTVLAKYFFDSYEEFEDPTIPNMFLWTEVGRLIDKKPETCKAKYTELRDEHLERYISGGYNLKSRPAIAIIFDHIINKDVRKEFSNANFTDRLDWQVKMTDALVQFFLDNIEVFKDSVCYFVCFEAVAKMLNTDLESCKNQWDDLVSLYVSILEDKKDDPDMQIDWRYIEMFDRIFDYGMDVTFLNGFKASIHNPEGSSVDMKKVILNSEKEEIPQSKSIVENQTLLSPRTDHRSKMILEFYLKNKDKFQNLKNKLSLWEPLTKDIGLNTTQCSHRFRHLKQTYIDMIQKEIDQPKANITWPYFGLCKKVFGYRSIKNKLKQGILTSDDDWLARELKQLITFFSKNFDAINNSVDDLSNWSPLATELGKSALSCKDKFVELRKCYRKLKTMKTRNPDVNISWSHFPMMDRIYARHEAEAEAMQVETLEEEHLDMDGLELEGDEDYQCIIVLQDGQEISDISNAQILIQSPGGTQQTEMDQEKLPEQPLRNIWTKRTKKLLLIHYINYMRSHRTKKIAQKQLWDEVASKIPNKTYVQCKRMFIKMKAAYKNMEVEKQKAHSLHSLMEKVLKIKPKVSITPMKDAKIHKTYKNVDMDPVKVESALAYYLNHIDDFVDPKFEKTYLWTELAQHISEPISTVYNKINYLKQAYNVTTEEIDGQKTPLSGILNEIIVKEVSMNVLLEDTKPLFDDNESNWSDELTERLLTWYLGNLDKFKNPKFNRSYLWMEASAILNKSPVVCSKKMTEIRTQYRNMVKNSAQELNDWRFLELCQKIYGTGKRSSEN